LKAKRLKKKDIVEELKKHGQVDVFTILDNGSIGDIVRMVRYEKDTNTLHGFIINPIIGKEHDFGKWSTKWTIKKSKVKWYKFTDKMKDHPKFEGRF